jgi:hypothetical protein
MNRNRLHCITATALVSILAMAGCKKEEPAAVAPPVAATTAPKAAATVSVTSLDLGTAVGADMKVTTAMTTFGPQDTIIAAASTATSVPGKLGVKWTYQDGKVVNDEGKAVNFTGNGATDFRIAKPEGWPAGKYKVEISLDGKVVQSKDFEVK